MYYGEDNQSTRQDIRKTRKPEKPRTKLRRKNKRTIQKNRNTMKNIDPYTETIEIKFNPEKTSFTEIENKLPKGIKIK